MSSPKIKFEIAKIDGQEHLAYTINVNNGWYVSGAFITAAQRKRLACSSVARRIIKATLIRRFWRHIGAR